MKTHSKQPVRLAKQVPKPALRVRIITVILTLVMFMQFKLKIGMYKQQKPVRLHKPLSTKEKISNFAVEYFPLLAIVGGVVLTILFVAACFAFPMGTEANIYYYHMV